MHLRLLAPAILLMVVMLVGCARPGPSPAASGMDEMQMETVDADTYPRAEALPPQPSQNGLFVVTITSRLQPVAINQIHEWVIQVETAGGEPVSEAEIQVDGGMPAHNHGLPTAPQVTEKLGNGDYLLQGVRFNMTGHWNLVLTIDNAGQADTVTFDMLVGEGTE